MENLVSHPQLLKPAEAARSLAISERKLWGLTKCGKIPCVRIGRSVRYDPRDLIGWIEARKSIATETAPELNDSPNKSEQELRQHK